ncbi:MAG: YdjY domain-containing protein [Akkermansiaceae bacterium]|nr:YdjY domain-containing protein [Akkermansiaceae bacterium]
MKPRHLLPWLAPLACTLSLGAEEPPPPAVPPSPAPCVVKIDDSRFRIGEVELNRKTRTIRFPVAVNMSEGALEFAVVHENGKVHESLFLTKINPSHLNIAFKLLRYQASEELFPLMDEGHPTGFFPQVDAKTRAAARVTVRVLWQDGSEEKSATLNEWISNARTAEPMPPGPWVYSGSLIVQGQFIAEATGDLIAIFTSRAAVLNFPGEDSDNDDAWIPRTAHIPAKGTAVTVEISPWKSTTQQPPP